MARVLAPGGQLMIYVWAMEQKNRHFEKQDVLVPWNRALCSQLFPEPGLSGRAQPSPPPCAHRCPAAGLGERWDSRRSHSVDGEPGGAANCCAASSTAGGEENGFYNALGKSFRSWFSSRSLDESALRRPMERARPPATTEGWAGGLVSTQPAPHVGPALTHPAPAAAAREPTLDQDVLVGASRKRLEWLSAPAAAKPLPGDPGRNGRGSFLQDGSLREACAKAGAAEGGPSAGQILRRVSAAGSTECAPAQQQPPEASAFTRYYHVFREGELGGLLLEHVSELRILSSGNDHGNWWVVAEKRGSQACV